MLTVLLTVAVSAAQADVGEEIDLRCTHHKSISGFTPKQYAQALKEMEADTEEYSECGQLIRKAQEEAANRARGSSAATTVPAASPLATTPAEQQAIQKAAHASPGPVSLAGQRVTPRELHLNLGGRLNRLPTPVLANLILLLVGGIGMAALRIWVARRRRKTHPTEDG
jgi:hypothetical protein